MSSTGPVVPALEIEGLTKLYSKGPSTWLGFQRSRVRAVDGLSLRVQPGEVYGFLGLNGAGKTTTIKSVLGFIQPSAGKVLIFGANASDPSARSRVGFAPEQAAFYDYLTARETLETLGGVSGLDLSAVRARIPALLEMVALTGEGDTQVRQFSKGMQQRLGIAQSLLADPDLLIFDEPTTGLDPLGRRVFKDLVRRLRSEGKAVFFSSHQIPDVQEICDRVGIIHRGRLVHEGLVTQLLAGGGTLEERFIELLGETDPAARKPTRLE